MASSRLIIASKCFWNSRDILGVHTRVRLGAGAAFGFLVSAFNFFMTDPNGGKHSGM